MLITVGDSFLLTSLSLTYEVIWYNPINGVTVNYRAVKEAKANNLKFTPEFLEIEFIQAIANNTKIFFGQKVSSLLVLFYMNPCACLCNLISVTFLYTDT